MTARQPALAACLILIVLGALWPRTRVQPLAAYDQPFYLGIADDLVRAGRFTDGYRFEAAEPRPPGMRFTPLYPALLAAIATVDPPLRRGMDCVVAQGGAGRPAPCRQDASAVRLVQFAMLAASLWLLWWSAARCTGRRRTGWLALGLALPTAPLLLQSVDYLMTEIVSLFLFVAAQALGLAALSSAGWRRWVPAGLVLGLAVLARPGFCGLAEALLLAGVVLAVRRRGGWSRLCAFAGGMALPVLPWIARNWLVLGRARLSFGYASHTFVQRLSFDAMSRAEWRRSFVCWLPDGTGIGGRLFGAHACDRFGWDRPDSFYLIGIGPMLEATLRASGGWGGHMRFLLHAYLLRDPVRQIAWHAAVTLPLALRGMYVDHYWGLVLAPVCLVATGRALRRRDAADVRFLLLALPAWFMLAFNAAVAVNQVRYNLMLVLPFSVAGAIAAEAAWVGARSRWRAGAGAPGCLDEADGGLRRAA